MGTGCLAPGSPTPAREAYIETTGRRDDAAHSERSVSGAVAVAIRRVDLWYAGRAAASIDAKRWRLNHKVPRVLELAPAISEGVLAAADAPQRVVWGGSHGAVYVSDYGTDAKQAADLIAIVPSKPTGCSSLSSVVWGPQWSGSSLLVSCVLGN